jgi:hypothetical protein
MAVKKTLRRSQGKTSVKKVAEIPVKDTDENELDPQEEKVLDFILKAVVVFVLGWLGLAVLMVIGGFFHLWG